MSEEDQAQQCLRIARLAWATGDAQRAIRFVQKSLRIRGSEEARVLLAEYEARQAAESAASKPQSQSQQPQPQTARPSSTSAASASASGSSVKREPSSGGSSGKPESPRRGRPFTPEQQAAARTFLRKADYYELLGIPRTATAKEITSAFRKAARLVHPDKNSCPEADQAFKVVNRAHECLSDEQKRRVYDLSGRDESVPEARPRGHAHSFHQQGFGGGGGIDPQDLFTFMFTGGDPQFFFRQQQARRRAEQAHQRQQQQQQHVNREAHPFGSLLQILPILLILLLSFITMPGGNSSSGAVPEFSLHKVQPFIVQRATANDIPYFVSMATHHRVNRDPGAQRRLEGRVERDYVDLARRKCTEEMNEVRKLETRARRLSGKDRDWVLGQAEDHPREWCERLQRLQSGRSL